MIATLVALRASGLVLSPLPDIRNAPIAGTQIIPTEYRGFWCLTKTPTNTRDFPDLAKIRIAARKLYIYGEYEHARRVSKRPDGALIVQFQDEADGTVFDEERQFTASADGRELILRSEAEDDSRLFRRCPI
jgi:hypothetical protein